MHNPTIISHKRKIIIPWIFYIIFALCYYGIPLLTDTYKYSWQEENIIWFFGITLSIMMFNMLYRMKHMKRVITLEKGITENNHSILYSGTSLVMHTINGIELNMKKIYLPKGTYEIEVFYAFGMSRAKVPLSVSVENNEYIEFLHKIYQENGSQKINIFWESSRRYDKL